jgi:nucleoside-diphosphate-sugar epimerase
MRVLVLGGTGALGRRVTGRLAAAGHDVRATARSEEAAQRVRALGAEPVDVDLFDMSAIRAAVKGSEAVLRLTTRIPPLTSMRRASAWGETARLRNESASLIVDACIAEHVPTYLHESVSFVYADGGDRWLDENAPTDVERAAPLRGALHGEANATRFSAAGGRGIVLRFAGFYAEDSPQIQAMAELARRRRIAVVGPSRNWFSAIHTDDAAAATVAALEAPAGTYNVADDEPLRLVDYMQALAAAAGARPLRRVPQLLGPIALGGIWSYLRRSQRISAGRLREATGWRPVVPDARQGWRRIAEAWSRAA